MIAPPSGTRIWLAAGITDMRRGMDGLATLVQSTLELDPFSGHVFAFRGRRGDIIKILWWSGDGMNLYAKRLETRPFYLASGRIRQHSSLRSPAFDALGGH
jgi:transposase